MLVPKMPFLTLYLAMFCCVPRGGFLVAPDAQDQANAKLHSNIFGLYAPFLGWSSGVRHRSGSLSQVPADGDRRSDGGYGNPSRKRRRAGCGGGVCCLATETPRWRSGPGLAPARIRFCGAHPWSSPPDRRSCRGGVRIQLSVHFHGGPEPIPIREGSLGGARSRARAFCPQCAPPLDAV